MKKKSEITEEPTKRKEGSSISGSKCFRESKPKKS